MALGNCLRDHGSVYELHCHGHFFFTKCFRLSPASRANEKCCPILSLVAFRLGKLARHLSPIIDCPISPPPSEAMPHRATQSHCEEKRYIKGARPPTRLPTLHLSKPFFHSFSESRPLSTMQCPCGKPWGHCFKADCVRRYKDNPKPNPGKGKWVSATSPSSTQNLPSCSFSSADSKTSTHHEQLRLDELFARQLAADQSTYREEVIGTSSGKDPNFYFCLWYPDIPPQLTFSLLRYQDLLHLRAQKQSNERRQPQSTSQNVSVLNPEPLHQCPDHVRNSSNRYCPPLRCKKANASKDVVSNAFLCSSFPYNAVIIHHPPTENKKGDPCECRLLDATIKGIPVHYRSKQKECLLHGKSAAEKKGLKRRIEEIKTGKLKRCRKSTAASKSSASAASSSSSSRSTTRLPIPSPSPELHEPKPNRYSSSNHTTMVNGDKGGGDDDDEPIEMAKEEEEKESKGKSKFTIKLGFAKTVKLNAMGEYVVNAVLRSVFLSVAVVALDHL